MHNKKHFQYYSSILLAILILFSSTGCKKTNNEISNINSKSFTSSASNESSVYSDSITSKNSENIAESSLYDTTSTTNTSTSSTIIDSNSNTSNISHVQSNTNTEVSNNINDNNSSSIESSSNSSTTSTETDDKTNTLQKLLKKGINFSCLEGGGNNGYVQNPKYYRWARQNGFDHIRLPVNFATHCGSAPNYTIDSSFFNTVDECINNALNEDLYIILDQHGWGEINDNVVENSSQFYAIWNQVSKHYQKYSNHLLFEILNEPNNANGKENGLSAARLITIQNKAIEIIRKTNPNRILVAAVPNWNTMWSLYSLELPANDPNIIVTIHSYETLDFTHQGATWAGKPAYQTVSWTEENKSTLEELFKTAGQWQKDTGRVLWLGEFGVYQNITSQLDKKSYISCIRSLCEKYNIGWCYWEFCYGFGFYNLSNDKYDPYMLSCLID